MAVSVTQRPPSFTPVNNPVVYKFAVTGGPFTLYRLVIGVYRESDDSLIGEMSKSPNVSGDILADVSSLLKTVLYRDWDLTDLSEDQIGSIGFYIKYQEFYTGSATSPVDDVANVSVAVIASRQIISNAVLTEYEPSTTAKKFLTKFDNLKMWRGYDFSLSFLVPAAYPNMVLYYVEYYDDVTIITSSVIPVTGDNCLARLFITPSSDNTKKILATLNDGTLSYTTAPSAWTDGANPFGAKNDTQFTKNNAVGGTTYSAYQAVDIGNGETPSDIAAILRWTKDVPLSGNTFDAYIKFYDTPGGTLVGTSHAGTYTTSLDNVPFIFSFSALSGDAAIMEISFVVFGGTNNDDVVITILPNQFVYAATSTDISETKEITVLDPCANPVYLFWKNSLGGDAFWMFDKNQELTWNSDERKAKQLLLFAEDITENEFDAINEVNTPGVIYQPAFQELTTSLIKTAAKTDQQLYVIETDGSKIGVVNINRTQSTKTKQEKHIIDVAIEYPELFL